MIDFFGSGYDVSERMGILANLEGIHYQMGAIGLATKGRLP